MKNINLKDLAFYTICISMIIGFGYISYPYSAPVTKNRIDKLELKCDSLTKQIEILRKLI